MFHDALIRPCPSGFGEFEQCAADLGDGWEDEDDLLAECRANIEAEGVSELYELGVDELPEGLEDIRGRIRNQDGRIFGWLDEEDLPRYFAVVEA